MCQQQHFEGGGGNDCDLGGNHVKGLSFLQSLWETPMTDFRRRARGARAL